MNRKNWFIFTCLGIALLLQTACSTSRLKPSLKEKRLMQHALQDSALSQCHFGFQLTDLKTGTVLVAQDNQKLFIPASNTKILSLFAALKLLAPDSLPAFRYTFADNGVLLLRPMADPTFLNTDFEAWQTSFSFLKSLRMPIRIDTSRWQASPHGLGWMWDDFSYSYSAERTAMPILGNGFFVEHDKDTTSTDPPFFQKNLVPQAGFTRPKRSDFSSSIFVPDPDTSKDYSYRIPFFDAQQEGFDFLANILETSVQGSDLGNLSPSDFFLKKGCPTDTVLRRMMYQSDNLIAEHLLLQCAAVRQNDTLSDRNWLEDSLFIGLVPKARWVDGSGLSRYNLFSPLDLSNVLGQMWQEVEHTRLLDVFPTYGKGTLRAWDAESLQIPQLYAKSGSMSGIYCLSGYLQTKSGRWLSFSCMSNGFVGSNTPIQEAIKKLLTQCSTSF